MKTWLQIVIIACAVTLTGCDKAQQFSDLITDSWKFQIFHGGPIYTMDTSQPEVEAVVISDEGRINYAGSLETANSIYPRARHFDLEGRTLMPGFIEQHLHPFLAALTLSMPVIAPEAWVLPDRTWPAARNHDEYLAALRQAESALEDEQEILWTWGFNQYFHGDINRQLLDDISATRPIAVWHRSAHEFYLNSAFIERFGIQQQDIDKLGPMVAAQVELEQGHFYEAGAFVYLLPIIFPELGNEARFRAGLQQMVGILHSNGVTAYNEPGAYIPPHLVAAFTDILSAPSTPLYSFFIPGSQTPYLMHGEEGLLNAVEQATQLFGDNTKLRFFDKQVKILFDGAIISQLMQMKEGYLDGHHGEWIQSPQEVATLFKIFWDADYQIHVHVNGDEGLERLINILAENQRRKPRSDHRTTIVHFANSTTEQVRQLSKLGAIISANPYYVTGFGEKFAEVGLDKQRAHAMVRLGDAERRGISVSLHSDMPMAPAKPLFLAWSAATRTGGSGEPLRPDLVLSRRAALRAITIDAAYSWGMERKLGSIEAGKVANFTLLDEDPYQVPLDTLKDIEVIATIFEGRYFPVKHQAD